MSLISDKKSGSAKKYLKKNRMVFALGLVIAGSLIYLSMDLGVQGLDGFAQSEAEDSLEEFDAVYNITGSGITPYSRTVGKGDRIGLSNSRSQTVTVEFDRDIETLVIESGEVEEAPVDSITYFEVFNQEGLVGRGKINVQ